MPSDRDGDGDPFEADSVEFLLFDSLAHHLVEKGVLTKNDALSVVQTAAQVVRGRTEATVGGHRAEIALARLQRAYASFEALAERNGGAGGYAENVRILRPPLHRDRPRFDPDD